MVDRRLSRREWLSNTALGALAYAGAPLGRVWAADSTLITKAIPSSGEALPVIGLGTTEFRRDVNPELKALFQRMADLGGRVIDTAAAYGNSESIIGEELAALGLRSRMFIATKLTAGGLFGGNGEDSLDRSLKCLQTDHVDLLQVHNLDGVDELMPKMQAWKKSGRIRYIGITTSQGAQQSEMMQFMRRWPLDFVQVNYSIGDRQAAGGVLPLAIERRIAVLVNLPLGRASLIEQVRARTLPAWAADIDVSSWGQFFLKYVVSHPAVTCAIPGSTQIKHVQDNLGAARGRMPDAAMRRRMEAFWDGQGGA